MLTIVLRVTPRARLGAWPPARAVRRSDWEHLPHDATHLAPAATTATLSANRRVMRRMIPTTPPHLLRLTDTRTGRLEGDNDPLTGPTYS